ncbi:MAG: hypothetical protein QG652_112 [Pseudomonadota bacterium]|nr:hypothetical protein [Pseudomonadota bacterium]
MTGVNPESFPASVLAGAISQVFILMSMVIIQADLSSTQHAAAVVALLDSYARDPAGGGQPLAQYTRQNLVAALRQRMDTLVLLAYDGDQAVGLVIAFEGFSTFMCRPLLNIHDVVVLAAYRGRGIAGRLLDAAENIARQRGCCKLTLEVLSNNLLAQSVYRKAGFAAYELDAAMGQAWFWQKKL